MGTILKVKSGYSAFNCFLICFDCISASWLCLEPILNTVLFSVCIVVHKQWLFFEEAITSKKKRYDGEGGEIIIIGILNRSTGPLNGVVRISNWNRCSL